MRKFFVNFIGPIGGGLSGDPHFTSFDGKRFDYQGACEYTLVEPCGNDEGLDYFKIIGNFNKPYPHFTVTVTVSVRVEYNNSVYEFRGNRGTLVNDVPVTLPYSRDGISLSFVPSNRWVSERKVYPTAWSILSKRSKEG